MEGLVNWYQNTLGQFVPKEIFVFFVSMLPLIELRGGLLCASMLKIPLLKANIICVLGNLVPIPFILMFIKKIFEFMKKHNILKGLVEKLEQMAVRKDDSKAKGQFLFLLLFVGIPIPGTGAWSGSLIAALMEFDMKKTVKAILLGLMLAVVIMDIVSYGVLGNIVK
ncbi:MAG: small multi-drug export protein [Erysipelotrichaceae bacterium]|nr:small multi-drug export protein [Erysipelotrichaceae bacterium]